MKKTYFAFLLVLLATLDFFSQTSAPTLSVIASPNSQIGWIYFKDPNTVNPNTLFTVYASNFGLGTDDAMQFVKEETDNLSIKHSYYTHYYKTLKVDIGQLSVHSRNNKSYLLNGQICTGLNMSVVPFISATDAITYAKSYINATVYMWEDSLEEQKLQILKIHTSNRTIIILLEFIARFFRTIKIII